MTDELIMQLIAAGLTRQQATSVTARTPAEISAPFHLYSLMQKYITSTKRSSRYGLISVRSDANININTRAHLVGFLV